MIKFRKSTAHTSNAQQAPAQQAPAQQSKLTDAPNPQLSSGAKPAGFQRLRRYLGPLLVAYRIFAHLFGGLAQYGKTTLSQFLASLSFYTVLPIPAGRRASFYRIARFAPLVGLLLGGGLGLLDSLLTQLQMPLVMRTALVVVSWVAVTGGLHLDGAMDSADGLAVMDPKRRLAVMADSRSGAFGVMAAIALILLKFAALMALPVDGIHRTVALMAAAGWGRWGQVLAIDRYAYLKKEGKGAFHKEQLRSPEDLWPGLIGLLALSAAVIGFYPLHWMLAVGMVLGGFAIAFGTGAWFERQLGGHTGDTYGAVVEWTEALLLCLLTLL